MAISTDTLPSKCCCCSLRAGSIVIGSFSLIVAMLFLGLSATGSSLLKENYNCKYTNVDGKLKKSCFYREDLGMLANLLAILAILNAAQVVVSIGLIWGASKRIVCWTTGYLIITGSWTLLHSAVATSYLFATADAGLIALIAVFGLLIFGLALISLLTVLSFRTELIHSRLHYPGNELPTHLLPQTFVTSHQAGWSGHAVVQPVDSSAETAPKVFNFEE